MTNDEIAYRMAKAVIDARRARGAPGNLQDLTDRDMAVACAERDRRLLKA